MSQERVMEDFKQLMTEQEGVVTELINLNTQKILEDFPGAVMDQLAEKILTIGELMCEGLKPDLSFSGYLSLAQKTPGNRALRRAWLKAQAEHYLLAKGAKFFSIANYTYDAISTLEKNINKTPNNVEKTPRIICETVVELGLRWAVESNVCRVVTPMVAEYLLLLGVNAPPVVVAGISVAATDYIVNKVWPSLWQSANSSQSRLITNFQQRNTLNFLTPDFASCIATLTHPTLPNISGHPVLLVDEPQNIFNISIISSLSSKTKSQLYIENRLTKLSPKILLAPIEDQTSEPNVCLPSRSQTMFSESEHRKFRHRFSANIEDTRIVKKSNPDSAFQVCFGSSIHDHDGMVLTYDSVNGVHNQDVQPDITGYVNLHPKNIAGGISIRTDSNFVAIGGAIGAGLILGHYVYTMTIGYLRECEEWEKLSPQEKAQRNFKDELNKYQVNIQESSTRYFNLTNWGKDHKTINKKVMRSTFNDMDRFIRKIKKPELLSSFRYMCNHARPELNSILKSADPDNIDETFSAIQEYQKLKTFSLATAAAKKIENNDLKDIETIAVDLKKADTQHPILWLIYAKLAEVKDQLNVNNYYDKAAFFAKTKLEKQNIFEEQLRVNLKNKGFRRRDFSGFLSMVIKESDNTFRNECARISLEKNDAEYSIAELAYSAMTQDSRSNDDEKCFGFIRLAEMKEKQITLEAVETNSETLQQVKELFKKAAECKAKRPELVLKCTLKLHGFGMYQEAYESAKHGQKNDSSIQAQLLQAHCALMVKEFDEATKISEKLLKDTNCDNATLSECHRMLGNIKFKNGQNPQSDYHKAITLNSDNYIAHHELGVYFMSKEQFENARIQFEICAKNPDDTHAQAKVALMLFKRGKRDEAKAKLSSFYPVQKTTADEKIPATRQKTIETVCANYVMRQYMENVRSHECAKFFADVAFLMLQKGSRAVMCDPSSEGELQNFATTLSFLCEVGIKEYIWSAWERSHYDSLEKMQSMIVGSIPLSDPRKICGSIKSKIFEDLQNLYQGTMNLKVPQDNLSQSPPKNWKEVLTVRNVGKTLSSVDTVLFFSSKFSQALVSHDLVSATTKERLETFNNISGAVQTGGLLVKGASNAYDGFLQVREVTRDANFFANAKPGLKKLGNAGLMFMQFADVCLDKCLTVNYLTEKYSIPDNMLLHAGRAAFKTAISYDVGLGMAGVSLIGGPIAWATFGIYVSGRFIFKKQSIEVQTKIGNIDILIMKNNYSEADQSLTMLENRFPVYSEQYCYIQLKRIDYFMAQNKMTEALKNILALENELQKNDSKSNFLFQLYEKKCRVFLSQNNFEYAHQSLVDLKSIFKNKIYAPAIRRVELNLRISKLRNSYDDKKYKQAIEESNELLMNPEFEKEVSEKEIKYSILELKLFSWLNYCEEIAHQQKTKKLMNQYEKLLVFLFQNVEIKVKFKDVIHALLHQLLKHEQHDVVIELTNLKNQDPFDGDVALVRCHALFMLTILKWKKMDIDHSPTNDPAFNEIRSLIKKVLQTDPQNLAAHELMGQLLTQEENYPELVLYLEKVISSLKIKLSKIPKSGEAANHPGSITDIKSLQQAITFFENTYQETKNWMRDYVDTANRTMHTLYTDIFKFCDKLIMLKKVLATSTSAETATITNYSERYGEILNQYSEWKKLYDKKDKFLLPSFIVNLKKAADYQIEPLLKEVRIMVQEFEDQTSSLNRMCS